LDHPLPGFIDITPLLSLLHGRQPFRNLAAPSNWGSIASFWVGVVIAVSGVELASDAGEATTVADPAGAVVARALERIAEPTPLPIKPKDITSEISQIFQFFCTCFFQLLVYMNFPLII
jgi:hypothetical protein